MIPYALIGIILFLILLLVAIHIGVNKKETSAEEEGEARPVIHQSGIYSIVRKSPRESIDDIKPPIEEIRKYLGGQNEDIYGAPLNDQDRELIIRQWQHHLETNLSEIEEGDKEGVEFYYFDFANQDQICAQNISKGQFVTREQIFKYPKIIPPFHLGCQCFLKRYRGDENLRETTVVGMQSFFDEKHFPEIPKWQDIDLSAKDST
ncbi:MAG: hypothetical protein GF398_05500 [Chitinivibrionales bacterium]|nr:hypothetical protein [Chitinivibrionales bacterium]